MAAKINISVPDELQKRISELRISPSKLYQDAARARVKQEDALLEARKARNEEMPEGDAMNAIIKRLEQERKESEDNSFDLGEKEGLAFAKTANYETLKYAATVLAENCDLAERDLTKDPVLADYFQDLLDDENNLTGELSEKWLRGWAWSLRAFWNKLPEDLKK